MARPPAPTGLARVGFGVALAAFTLILALGYSRQVVEVAGEGIGCGSVLSPVDQPACDELRASRRTLMMAVGIPGVALGLGVVIFSSRRERGGSWGSSRTRE